MTVATPTRPIGTVIRGRTVYARTALFGLLTLEAGGIMLLIAALLAGDPGFAVFAAILTALPLVTAVALTRFGTGALVATAVVSLLALVFLGPELPFSVGHPSSFFDFAPGIVGVSGALIAMLAAVAGIVRRRQAAPIAGATSAQRRAALVAIAVLVAASAGSGIATLGARTSVSASARNGVAVVRMKSTKFAPLALHATAGQKTRFVVDNADPALHTFTIKQLGIDETVRPGSQKVVELTAPDAGTYTFICRWHDGMTGTLTVTR